MHACPRCFGAGREDERVGHYPSGHWIEQSGRLGLVLGVEVRDGGWYWRHRRSTWLGIPLPGAFSTLASKVVEGERYRFCVEVRAPFLGKLLAYSGTLAPLLPGADPRTGARC